MKAGWLLILLFCISWELGAQEIQKFSFTPPVDMTRADIYALKASRSPKAVLVLCPGANGNGEGLIRQQEWQTFAQENHLGLAGLSFASNEAFLMDCNRGYYCASKGSGDVLLAAIRKIYGNDLPLLLYGFSGGAHFTSGFVEWKPERVISWSAYSAGWWDTPHKSAVSPPGIVVCGDADPRYGASMIYFKQGRAAGKPWLWVSLPDLGHRTSPELEEFVRQYFAAILDTNRPKGLWVDVDLSTQVSESFQRQQPSLTGWLPDARLFERWKAVHRP